MMKKITLLLASFAAVSAFAAPLEVVSYSNGTYDFRVNEAGYVKVQFYEAQGRMIYNAGFWTTSSPYTGGFDRWGGDGYASALDSFNAGDTFGIVAHAFSAGNSGRYAWAALQNSADFKFSDSWYGGTNAIFLLDGLTITDTVITGNSTYGYGTDHPSPWGGWPVTYYETTGVSFTLTWSSDPTFPAGNTNGQPLPGVAVALVLGAGAYAARRRRTRQA